MEETLSLIVHGCKLARNLESNIPHYLSTTTTFTQPNHSIDLLSNSCQEIQRVFQSAVNRLSSHHHPLIHPYHPSSTPSSSSINNISNIIIPNPHHEQGVYGGLPPEPVHHALPYNMSELDTSVQKWLKSSYTQAIETHLLQASAASSAHPFSTSSDHHDVVNHNNNNLPFITTTTTTTTAAAADHRMSKQKQQQQLELGLEMPMIINSSTKTTSGAVKSLLLLDMMGGRGFGVGGTTEDMDCVGAAAPSNTDQGAGGDQYHHQVQHGRPPTTGDHDHEGSDSGKITTPPAPVQRSRKRKDGADKRTVRVAGPRTGNTEIPPDDGFTWRKYGQKEILGSMFPRGYYRCTHKNFFGCEAKKQVQRLDHDPNTYEVTYYGNHTCQMGMDTTTTTIVSGGGGCAGPSHVPDDQHSNLVVELVDAMFNSSGGSSNNSMDSIFLFPPSSSSSTHHQQDN